MLHTHCLGKLEQKVKHAFATQFVTDQASSISKFGGGTLVISVSVFWPVIWLCCTAVRASHLVQSANFRYFKSPTFIQTELLPIVPVELEPLEPVDTI